MQQTSPDQPQTMFGAQPPMGQQGTVIGAQPPMGQQGTVIGAQPPMGQQGTVIGAQPPMGQQGTVIGAQPPIGQQGTVFGTQPSMGQQGYVYAGQPVLSAPGPRVPVNQVGGGRTERPYSKSLLSVSKFFEFFSLLIAWTCCAVYINRTFDVDGRATTFAGIAIFCWVVIIIMQIVFLLGINKNQRYFRTPSISTLIALTVQVLVAILLTACTTNLIMRGVDLYKANKAYSDLYGKSKPFDVNNLLLIGALIFGVLASVSFLDDIPLLTKMYRLQRAKEIAVAEDAQ